MCTILGNFSRIDEKKRLTDIGCDAVSRSIRARSWRLECHWAVAHA